MMSMTKHHFPTLRLAALLLCLVGPYSAVVTAQDKNTSDAKAAPQMTTPTGPQRIVKEGIEIEFTIDPLATGTAAPSLMAGQDAVMRFRIRDRASRTPLARARPAAWASRRDRPAPPDPQQCREKVQSFMQGSLRVRPDVDLNAYYILALNQEPNISVIDPLLGFGGSKLITLLFLKSPGEDWVLSDDRSRLFVSMPLVNQVAVVDTATWKIITNIDAGFKPARIALQPDGKYLWVANDLEREPGGVTVIDTGTLKVAKSITTGAGRHEIAFGAGNKFAFIMNRDVGTISVVDVRQLRKVKDVGTGAPTSSMAFSPLSKAIYVTNQASGNVAVIDSESHKLLTNIAVKPGLGKVRFAPSGRWGFITNPSESVVHIFDASTNRFVHEVAVGKAPDQLAFSDSFAYVRSLGTEEVTTIRLSTLGKELDTVKFPGGQEAPGSSSNFASSAEAFVATPESGSMLIANPADKMIYYYSEGMAAPMGNFQNYRRVPRAVTIVDRSLREETLGVYATTVRLPKEGVYDVSLLLDSPRIVHCFEAAAKPNPAITAEQKTALRIEYLNKERSLRAGEDYKLRFRLADAKTNRFISDLKDVRVLVFLTPGIWQKRETARSVGEGIYEIAVNVPQEGVYMVFVECRSRGVNYRQLPFLTMHATSSPW